MASSGTVSQTTFNVRKVIDRAYGRCRIIPQKITAEMINRAQDNLYLMLSSLPAEGMPLWCMEKLLLPFKEGQSGLVLPVGTVDVVNAFYRSLTTVTGAGTSSPLGLTITFQSPTVVTTVGLKWVSSSVPVAVQYSDDGLTWVTLLTYYQAVSAGNWTWIDLDGATSRFNWRVIPTGSGGVVLTEDSGTVLQEDESAILMETTETMSLSDWRFCNNPSEILMARLNRDQYQQMPNKTFTGRPLQYWLDRQVDRPVMRLWPAPDSGAQANLATVWRHRHIMDVGNSMTTSLDVPQRWVDAVIARLAGMLAIDSPEVDPSLIPMLQALSVKSSSDIWGEERDRSNSQFTANIGVYTR